MDSRKYIGMDVHKETVSITVLNSSGNYSTTPTNLGFGAKSRVLQKSGKVPNRPEI
jgi:hypothetical protein